LQSNQAFIDYAARGVNANFEKSLTLVIHIQECTRGVQEPE